MNVLRLPAALLVLNLVAACSTTKDPAPAQPTTPTTPTTPSPQPLPVHLTLGNPSGATADINQPTNYLLSKPQYALSYHRDRGIPNWVSWHLDATWRGSAARQDDFRPDNTLPAGWYLVQATSYSGSGFDRGHMCPSADRTNTITDNSATFFMTNMVPQAPRNNQQTWANLEDYARSFLATDNEVYIICGSYGRGGIGSNSGVTQTLDNGRVTVPARLWKVVVILTTGTDDATRVNTSTRVIAIDTPNENSISTSWGQYRVSIDAIEVATGLDILSAVSTSAQQSIESRIDTGPTN